MSYYVTAPLVGVNGQDGKIKYLYRPAMVPSDVSKEDIERLLADGLIAKVEAAEEVSAKPLTAAEKKAAAETKA